MNSNILFELLGDCIVKNSCGNVIFPCSQEKLERFKNILKSSNTDNIYEYDDSFYEYSTRTIDIHGSKYFIEELRDVTSIIYNFQSKIAKYRTDFTTGLNTKELAYEKFDSFIDEVKSRPYGFACIIIDADNFKSINDQYGHLSGDVVLKEIANIILSSTRKQDIIGRIGGEEFLLVLKEISLNDALIKSESIRMKAENKIVKVNGISIKMPTLSLGLNYINGDQYSKFDSNELIRKSMIEDSDYACYLSKQSGRNKVTLYNNGKVRKR